MPPLSPMGIAPYTCAAPQIMFDFKANYDAASIQAAVETVEYIGKGTATGAALTFTVNQLLSSSASGYREGAVPLVAVVISDGETQETQETLSSGVQGLQATNADIYSYGIGDDLLTSDGSLNSELLFIASDPDVDHAHQIESFITLSDEEFINSVLLLVGCSPQLLSFGCDGGSGSLTLRFSRSVDPASYKPSSVTLQSTVDGIGGQKRTIVGLSSSDDLSPNITVFLDPADAEVIKPTHPHHLFVCLPEPRFAEGLQRCARHGAHALQLFLQALQNLDSLCTDVGNTFISMDQGAFTAAAGTDRTSAINPGNSLIADFVVDLAPTTTTTTTTPTIGTPITVSMFPWPQ